MTQPATPFRLISMRRSRLAALALVILLTLATISFLGINMARDVARESESRSDNAQWALTQIEVELLSMLTTADAAHRGAVDLDAVRLRYDILYSRLKTLRDGRVFAGLRETPRYAAGMQQLTQFLKGELPYVDGADDALRAHLPTLIDRSKAVIEDARAIALVGVKVIAQATDERRSEVSRTLALASAITMALVVFLVAMVVLLLRLIGFNRLRAAENLAMLSRLDAVVSTAMEALVTLDSAGRIVDFNDAACQTFGYTRGEAVGTDMAAMILTYHGGDGPFRKGAAPDVAAQGRFRIHARHKSGRVFPAEVAISHMVAGDDTLYVVCLRDLSTQLAAERALVAARDEALAGEKAKTDLLVVMSHEIRTPLNGMIGTIELLDSTELQPQQREYLRIMQASGKLLMHHVNDVLDIARLDSGKAPFRTDPVDLVALVQEVIENQTPAAKANANTLTCTPPPDGRTMVQADGAQLRQVLLNLVGNAVKFTRNGKIAVAIRHLGPVGPTEILVKDTGIGIPQGDLERIFDDFVKLDATYARRSSGTGLGLGIVRRIVAQMGGTLTVASTAGQGSTFLIIAPLDILGGAAPARPRKGPGKTAAPLARPMVTLVVEDNDFNRLIVRDMLLKEGHDVVEARDGDEGIALANARRFDMILMDISMPGIDGLQAAQAILTGQGLSKDTPILAMTAHALASETARFRAGGMKEVLIKPVTREVLKAVLQTATADMTPVARPDGHVVLDRKILDAFFKDLGPAKAGELMAKFRAEAASTVAQIVSAFAGQMPDLPDVETILIRDLHRLEGSAAMFGAVALHGALAQVELSWKTGQGLGDVATGARIDTIWRSTEAAFQEAASLAQSSSLR